MTGPENEPEKEELEPASEKPAEPEGDASQAESNNSQSSAAQDLESANKEKPASEEASDEANKSAVNLTLTQHHVSHLLTDVLGDTESDEIQLKGLRFPMVFDLLLGAGLLVAVGGFTVGLFHMYLVHSASQCISEERYKAAIHILKGAPLPQVFARPGSDTEELLSKARYLDAMKKLEAGQEINDALKELSAIQPGSKYFALAQEAINENTEPAPMMLQGGAETTETSPGPSEPKQSLIEKTLREDE